MNCASATMPASFSSRIASLFSSIVVSLRKRSSFSCAAASVPSETCTRPALRNNGSSSRSRRMSVTRVLMPQCTVTLAGDQLLAERDELLAVDRRFLVREDEESDLEVAHQGFDLVGEFLRVAHPVLAPELPLRAEAAGERAAAREIRHRNPGIERHVDVLVPLEQRPVRRQRVEVLDDRARRRRDDLAVLRGRRCPGCCARSRPARPSAIARSSSTMISSPSPRTM